MFLPHHILAAVAVGPGDDASLAADVVDAACAFMNAAAIARRAQHPKDLRRSKLTILHVVPPKTFVFAMDSGFAPPSYFAAVAEIEDANRKATVASLTTLRARAAAAVAADVDVVSSVVDTTGDVGEAIVDEAHKRGVDCIVVMSHGRRNLTRLLLGSVAQRVLHRSRVPVLLIPADAAT